VYFFNISWNFIFFLFFVFLAIFSKEGWTKIDFAFPIKSVFLYFWISGNLISIIQICLKIGINVPEDITFCYLPKKSNFFLGPGYAVTFSLTFHNISEFVNEKLVKKCWPWKFRAGICLLSNFQSCSYRNRKIGLDVWCSAVQPFSYLCGWPPDLSQF
jgi:hypothetical protein